MGPLGVYRLLRYILERRTQNVEHEEALSSKLYATSFIAFLGALFYLLNLGTVQQFYAPFEMFTTQYALLPWIILFSLKYLGENKSEASNAKLETNSKSFSNFKFRISNLKRKNLLLFSIFTLLAAPQAYAAHLWYAFFGVYTLFLISYALTVGDLKVNLKKSSVLIVLTLLINSFWLLPNLYYIFTSTSVPKESKQNRIFSQEYRVRNQENGYIQDVALTKGFYFQWSVFNFEKNRFEYLMPEWQDHLNNPFVAGIGYSFFSLAVVGMYLSIKQKDKTLISLLPFFILPFILLMNGIPPFSWFFNFLLKFPVFEEALRFVFTKLSILLVFGYALYFSVSLSWIFSKLKNKKLTVLTICIFLLAIFTYAFPLLRGNLISDKFKIALPDQYFQLWKYMESQPNKPVLTLPLHTFSGWQYYDWGYQGSGFIWFGMKQPVLDRDSDRWSAANEQAFRELQYTLYSQHPDQFYTTLQKYNVGYVVWDTSVITPTEKNRKQILYQRETTNALATLKKTGRIKKLQQFGTIQIFKTSFPTRPEILKIKSQVSPNYRWSFIDQAYLDHSDYITSTQALTRLFTYPFRDFLTPSDRIKPEIASSISDLKHSIVFSAERLIKNQQVPNTVTLKKDVNTQVVEFRTKNFTRGIAIQNETFPHNLGYVIGFKSRNVKGLPLRFCLKNLYSSLCDTYDELSHSASLTADYFVIPPYESGRGYGIYIDNISYGNYETINELESVTVYPLYYNYLAKQSDVSGEAKELSVLHNGSAFNNGWIAFSCQKSVFSCRILNNHVLVNNWSNGWVLSNQQSDISGQNLKTDNRKLITIFWPQYLQYLGFILLMITLLVLVLKPVKKIVETDS